MTTWCGSPFQNTREYRDARIAEIDAIFEDLDDPEDLVAYRAKRKTLSNHLKAIQALFNFARPAIPIAQFSIIASDGRSHTTITFLCRRLFPPQTIDGNADVRGDIKVNAVRVSQNPRLPSES
jgi:hypothetical protein